MNEVNPYQSPEAESHSRRPEDQVGVWRQGSVLVVHRDAKLPMFCVKTNEPVTHVAPLKVDWDKFFLSGRYTIELPIKAVYWRRYQWLYWGTTIVCLLCAAGMGIAAMSIRENQSRAVGGIGISLVTAIVAGAVYSHLKSTRYFFAMSEKSNRTHIWIMGVHADYLDRFPEWPYRRGIRF